MTGSGATGSRELAVHRQMVICRARTASNTDTTTPTKGTPMKRLLIALTALAIPLTAFLTAAPASAEVYDRSTAPTTTTNSTVARGGTIRVYVHKHRSKVLSRTSTLWQKGRRVHDWSPRPGTYRVKTVIRWQPRIWQSSEVWVPYENCQDWSTEDYDACAEDEYGDWVYQDTVRLGTRRATTRYNNVRVAADETPGCVSRPEFRAVRDGMTQARVHGIFGTRGRVTYSGSGGTGREYVTCVGDEWSYVSVDYAPRVWFKWMYISY
jgi:hypothetical protein